MHKDIVSSANTVMLLGCPRKCVFDFRRNTEFFEKHTEFRGIPSVFAYWIPHVSKWSRFQILPSSRLYLRAIFCKNKSCKTSLSQLMSKYTFLSTDRLFVVKLWYSAFVTYSICFACLVCPLLYYSFVFFGEKVLKNVSRCIVKWKCLSVRYHNLQNWSWSKTTKLILLDSLLQEKTSVNQWSCEPKFFG